MEYKNEKNNASLIHLSSFAGYFFPFGSIIVPLIIWQALKNKSPYLNKHGKEAVNFNMSFGLYIFILGIVALLFLFGSVLAIFKGVAIDFENHYNWQSLLGFISITFLASAIFLIKLALIIMAVIKANNGELYKYPFTIRFIK